jgi:hypothetical protein
LRGGLFQTPVSYQLVECSALAHGIVQVSGAETDAPNPNKNRHSRGGLWSCNGRGGIRTPEGIASRFTVCPLWPLGYSPDRHEVVPNVGWLGPHDQSQATLEQCEKRRGTRKRGTGLGAFRIAGSLYTARISRSLGLYGSSGRLVRVAFGLNHRITRSIALSRPGASRTFRMAAAKSEAL